MTKEEKREIKKRKKELMKFSRTAKLLYIVFILLLLSAGAFFVSRAWKEAEKYQKASARTRVDQAIEKVEEISGLELRTDMIPVRSEENSLTYRLYDESKAVADVKLNKNRSSMVVLAIYDEAEITSLVSYKVLVPENSVASVKTWDQNADIYDFVKDSEDDIYTRFSIPGKQVLGEMGIVVPSFKWIEISGIFDISQLSISSEGRDCSLYKMEDGRYFAASVADEGLNLELRKRAAYVSEKYANYISNDYSFYELNDLICYGAPFAGRLLNVTLTWYGQHDSVEANNMTVSGARRLSDSDYMCNVRFDYVTKGIYGVNDEESKLTVYLHLDSDGVWRISELMNNIQMPWMDPYKIYEN